MHLETVILDLTSNWAKLASNMDKSDTFKIIYLFILAHRAKINRKLILTSRRFVPFYVNLAQFEAKLGIPVGNVLSRLHQPVQDVCFVY